MSAEQILFLNKNVADFSDDNVAAAASQGNDYASFALNRSNNSAWMTTSSVDSDNTTWEVDLVDDHYITDILLLKHNFKAFTIQYWDGAAYVDFSTPISETVNAEDTSHFTFDSQNTTKIKITITGTQVANSDKQLFQFIATTQIGQLDGWPIIKPTILRNRKLIKMLSGKIEVKESIGAFKADLSVKILSNDADLTIVESLFASNEGFLVWLCGGDEDQFRSERIGYRLEDIYLMKCTNEWKPLLYKGLYQAGMKVDLKLSEVVS